MTRCTFFRCRLPNLCPALTVVFTRRGRNIPATAECRRWSPWSREEEKRSRLTSFLKDTCVADVAGYYDVGKTSELEALIRVIASCA